MIDGHVLDRAIRAEMLSSHLAYIAIAKITNLRNPHHKTKHFINKGRES